MGAEIRIDAIVLGYGRFKATTEKCLDSLLPTMNALYFNVVAVDNGSLDDSAFLLKEYQRKKPFFDVQINERNLGFAGGMNKAASQSNADWVMLINSDIVFPSGSIERLIACLINADAGMDIIAPLTNNAGNGQCVFVPGKSTEEIIYNAQEIIDNPCGIITPSYRADFCCVVIRTKLWKALGGLDLSYGRGYYEDFDFSLRARKLGSECGICEDSFVYHEGGDSFENSTENNFSQKSLIKENKKIFLRRHPCAELRHRRLDNLHAIKFLENESVSSLPYRIELAKKDLPKSFFKRFLWKKRLRKSGVNII